MFPFTNGIALIFSGTNSELVQFVNELKNSEAVCLNGELTSVIDAAWYNFYEHLSGVRFVFAQQSEPGQADSVVNDLNTIFPLILSNRVYIECF